MTDRNNFDKFANWNNENEKSPRISNSPSLSLEYTTETIPYKDKYIEQYRIERVNFIECLSLQEKNTEEFNNTDSLTFPSHLDPDALLYQVTDISNGELQNIDCFFALFSGPVQEVLQKLLFLSSMLDNTGRVCDSSRRSRGGLGSGDGLLLDAVFGGQEQPGRGGGRGGGAEEEQLQAGVHPSHRFPCRARPINAEVLGREPHPGGPWTLK
jgi:hypothetical protein